MKTRSLVAMTAMLAMVFFGCKESPYISSPGEASENLPDTMPSTVEPDPTPDPEGFVVPEGTINVYEAIEVAKSLQGSAVSAEKYFIKGYVTGFNRSESFETDFPKYGNDFVYISATSPSAEIQSSKKFYAYRILGKFGAKLPDTECIQVGDFVVISCYITNYGEVVESSGACFAYMSNNAHFNEVFPEFPGCPAPGEGEISVTEAEKIALTLEKKATSTEAYKIRGVVTSVETTSLGSYGNMTFNISDGLSYATCYQTYCKTASGKFTNVNQVAVGDTVLINGKIQNYNGTCEPYRAYVEESTNPNF